MTEVLQNLYSDSELVKGKLDEEIAEYQQAKGKLSGLRRNNFVLWKHIKKLKRKYRKLKVYHGIKDKETLQNEEEAGIDDEELLQLTQELDMMANDPDLATDLKAIKRETKNAGTHV